MVINKLKSNKLFRDSFWTLFGNAIGKGLTVLSGILVAKLLGKDVFGEYGLLKNTLLIIAIFSTMGLGYTSTIFVSRYKQDNENILYSFIKSLLYITFLFSGIIAFLIFIFSSQIACFLEDSRLSMGLKYLSVIIIFNALTTTQIGILAGFKLFKQTAYINILSGILNFIFSVGLTYIWGFNGALLALLLSQVINYLLNYLILRKQLSFLNRTNNQKAPLLPILRQSLPIALQEMSLSITHWLGTLLLLRLSNYGEVGLYSAASQWSAVILFIPIALRNVVLSYLSYKQSSDQRNKILLTVMSLYVVCTLVPSILIHLFSKTIIQFYGESFIGLSNVLIVSCYATVFNSIYNIFSSVFMSKNKNWLLYGITISRDILNLIGLYLLIVLFGINGAYSMSLSTITTAGITVLACIFFYRRIHC
ncbi:oligosaccharide flippase family protein [Phocaeicola barnesiae]|uniref:oligosaccharide flippase family protein n=1 Tax=Phocaeicola barnesiae TaxID=376804 RepID=UPI00266FEA25|nr:oligosaccharide flippase family protein [Phocaeicola barnesiae]